MTEFDQNRENDQSMEDATESIQEIEVGNVVKGEVLAIEGKQVIVRIKGARIEEIAPAKELPTLPIEDISEVVKVSDVLDLVAISTIGKDKEGGSYLLSKRHLDVKKVWGDVERDFQEGKIIKTPITNVIKGGLVVDIGVRGFVPAPMMEGHFIADFSDYKGKTLSSEIIEIEPPENRLILLHRAVVENEGEEKKREALSTIHEEDVLSGCVTRLTDFGAFVNLGGIDGLVHVSEILCGHVAKPSDVLAVSSDVNVRMLSINPEQEHVSLSIKDIQPEPWSEIDTKAPVGTVLDGTVKRLASFGAFVEVFPGVEGLIHISQISHKHIATLHEVLHEGDEMKVKILEVHPEEHHITLSIRALGEKPTSEEEPKNVESYELPEKSTGFTMGDILGDALKEEVEERTSDDSEE